MYIQIFFLYINDISLENFHLFRFFCTYMHLAFYLFLIHCTSLFLLILVSISFHVVFRYLFFNLHNFYIISLLIYHLLNHTSQVALWWRAHPSMQETLGQGRSPGGGHGTPLQYSCLENPMDRGACLATFHGVAKSQTQLKQLSTHKF